MILNYTLLKLESSFSLELTLNGVSTTDLDGRQVSQDGHKSSRAQSWHPAVLGVLV